MAFNAEVTDRVTGMPVPGVEVDVQIGQGKMNKAFTGSDGTCTSNSLSPSRPPFTFSCARMDTNATKRWRRANMIFKTDMVKLP